MAVIVFLGYIRPFPHNAKIIIPETTTVRENRQIFQITTETSYNSGAFASQWLPSAPDACPK